MLRISTKGRYATRIMVSLALKAVTRPARKQAVAEAEEISVDYVEQILLKLKTAGLVRSHRGAKGGFSLARDAASITVADVLEATEGPLSLVPCLHEKCSRGPTCVTQPLWRTASDALETIFSGTTIAELAEQAKQIQLPSTWIYEI